MLVIIIATVPNVEAAHECYFLVHDHHFLVMRPQKGYEHVCWMPQNFDVWTERHQVSLSVFGINIQCHFGLHVHNYVHLYATVGYLLQHPIYASLVVWVGPAQVEVRGNHPPCNADLSFGLFQCFVDVREIMLAIDVVLGITVGADISKTVISFYA